jgi:hypothetical protein
MSAWVPESQGGATEGLDDDDELGTDVEGDLDDVEGDLGGDADDGGEEEVGGAL